MSMPAPNRVECPNCGETVGASILGQIRPHANCEFTGYTDTEGSA